MRKTTQEQKIDKFCEKNIWITQRDAYFLGIARLASRVWDMEEKGYIFIREYIKVKNADGTSSYVKRYAIVKRPKEEVYNVC